jgi:predicted Zn finger-like uncharacterized protein
LYTRCPNCLSVFAIAAEQLKAAHGNVRCGTCLESFDAIPHLSDDPVAARSVAPVESQDLADDSKIASEQLSSTLAAVRGVASVNDAGAQAPASGPAFPSDASALPGDDPLETTFPQSHAKGTGLRRAPLIDEAAPAPLPRVLRVDMEEHAQRSAAQRRAIGYGSAAVALLVLLAGQYVFFMPEDAARRYPQWRGAIESVCAQIGCVLPERRDPARIRVVSRDVRIHPRYEGAMQIKATLVNSAPYRQPYPNVRFTLFNVNGQTIATRVFQPPEYLGRPVDAGARLRPKTQFQVDLDVLGPEEAAVSFEFSFL